MIILKTFDIVTDYDNDKYFYLFIYLTQILKIEAISNIKCNVLVFVFCICDKIGYKINKNRVKKGW